MAKRDETFDPRIRWTLPASVPRFGAAAIGALLALSGPPAAAAEYTLWPEQTAPPAPPPRDVPTSASEPRVPPHLGGAGTVIVDAAAGGTTNHVDSFQSVATVGVSYFVREHLSFGAELWGAALQYRSNEVAAYGAGARVGYLFPLGAKWVLYPALSLIFSEMSLPSRAPAPAGTVLVNDDSERRGLTAALDVPLLFRVNPSLVAGVGLALRQDLTNYELDPVYSTNGPNVGAFLTVAGWFHLGETVQPTVSSYEHVPL